MTVRYTVGRHTINSTALNCRSDKYKLTKVLKFPYLIDQLCPLKYWLSIFVVLCVKFKRPRCSLVASFFICLKYYQLIQHFLANNCVKMPSWHQLQASNKRTYTHSGIHNTKFGDPKSSHFQKLVNDIFQMNRRYKDFRQLNWPLVTQDHCLWCHLIGHLVQFPRC